MQETVVVSFVTPLCQAVTLMTLDDVHAAAEQLVQFHEQFTPLFAKEQRQDHAYT
jgi:hypothetical protein